MILTHDEGCSVSHSKKRQCNCSQQMNAHIEVARHAVRKALMHAENYGRHFTKRDLRDALTKLDEAAQR